MSPPPPDEQANSNRAWWRLPLLLAAVLGAILIYRGGSDDRSTGGDGESGGAVNHARRDDQFDSEAAEAVVVTIDFADESPLQVASIPWKHGMTVRDAMQIASDGEPNLRIHQRGEGAMAFLTQIGPKQNEGESGRNWIYEINDKSADRSFAIQPLSPGDRVLWSFAKPE